MSYIFFILISLFGSLQAADWLPSWNPGVAKQKILEYVRTTTDPNHPDYIPVSDRIATFDQDGTLWVEQPLYVETFYAADYFKQNAARHPEWEQTELFKALLKGDVEVLKTLDSHDVAKIVAVSHSGMTLEQFHQEVNDWLHQARHPRFQLPFTSLVYLPMIELIQLLRENQFQIYIVSGGGQEFIRTYAEKVYKISPANIIGTAGKVSYQYQDGHPSLTKIPEVLFIDDKKGKPEAINLFVGKKPVAAFGNSIGDQQMLEWSQSSPWKSLKVLVHHDDPIREYAYGPNSKVGTFPNALMQQANEEKWIVVSMKNDWKTIFKHIEAGLLPPCNRNDLQQWEKLKSCFP